MRMAKLGTDPTLHLVQLCRTTRLCAPNPARLQDRNTQQSLMGCSWTVEPLADSTAVHRLVTMRALTSYRQTTVRARAPYRDALSCVVAVGNEEPYQSQRYGISSTFGATFGARRRYLSMSLGFAVPARSRRKSSAARREPTFSATAAAMNWLSDTPSAAANSAAAFFTDVGSFNG